MKCKGVTPHYKVPGPLESVIGYKIVKHKQTNLQECKVHSDLTLNPLCRSYGKSWLTFKNTK